jgi:hypothetical protein
MVMNSGIAVKPSFDALGNLQQVFKRRDATPGLVEGLFDSSR